MCKCISMTLLVSCLFAMLLVSCKKGPGEGGRATINGKVFAVNYNSAMTVPQDSGYIGGQKVYIIYGDENAVGDNIDTDNNGSFEFQYLRKGTYKVYVFSKTSPNKLDSAMLQKVEITEKKAIVTLADFKIKTNKN
jgi:hypothetical protein